MPGRRAVLGLAAGAACAWSGVGSATPGCGGPLLIRAMAAMGGRRRLEHVRRLRWEGTARVIAGGRDVAIEVATDVVPFRSARSTSWLLSDGPAKSRALVIEPDGGWIERDGTRQPMPAAMLSHERAQYAAYGLMLLAPLCGADGHVREAGDTLFAQHVGAPDTRLTFDRAARLVTAENRVTGADGAGEVAQRFAFLGEIAGGGVRWWREMTIAENGAPYFELRLSRFEAT